MRLGSDPDRIERCADLAGRLAADLHDLRALRARTVELAWRGPARDRTMAGLGRADHELGRTADRLLTWRTALRRQAEAQRAASAPEVGPAHPPNPDLVPPPTRWRNGVPETLLTTDDRGDGRRVVAVGDLRTARRVVVVVPGMGSTAGGVERLVDAARRLQRAAGTASDVAVVAWLGYDAPAGVTAPWHADQVLTDGLARDGAEELRGFLGRLALATDAPVTLIGHSYGSLVVAATVASARDPAVDRVDQLVLAGSPGVGVADVAALDVASGLAVYAVATPHDAVAHSGWFGRAPTDPEFGAVVLDGGPWPDAPPPSWSHAHSAYFDAGSQVLDNLARVIGGAAPRRAAEPVSAVR